MSMRQLIEGDCGGVNPLMQLGGQFTRDVAHKDEGFGPMQFERGLRQDEQMVNEFLGQVAAPPQSFQMDTLLQEMRQIEQMNAVATHLQAAPRVIDEVKSGQWTNEFGQQHAPARMLHMQPQQQSISYAREFFDDAATSSNAYAFQPPRTEFCARPGAPYLAICPPNFQNEQQNQARTLAEQFFDGDSTATNVLPKALQNEAMEDWLNEFQTSKEEHEHNAANYNEKFWNRLQDEWNKLSEQNEYDWLSNDVDTLEPYKTYEFAKENPMSELPNALEKGKEYLAKGDIPSAVLCFEVAATKEPDNAEVWELLGISQAENEMDPQAIPALRRSLELNANNSRALMALAISYTNESMQANAMRVLINWLEVNPKYKHLVEQQPHLSTAASNASNSSGIHGGRLEEVQNLYLAAVRLFPQQVDSEVQEALGVLYNLSSEFDKAVDCFRSALQVNPQNAKVWNRLGASLANGSRSVEAVEAYQQALQLEPGFIRVRYNVGVCCMNLKAYKQAVEHFLIALNMQANSEAMRELPVEGAAARMPISETMSESIWSTMRMVISLMGRSDLQPLINNKDLDGLSKAFQDS